MHNLFPHMDTKSHVSGFCIHIFDISWIFNRLHMENQWSSNVASCENLDYLYVALL